MARNARVAWGLASLSGVALLLSLYLPRDAGSRSLWDLAHGMEHVAATIYVILAGVAYAGIREPSRKLAAFLVPLAALAVGWNWSAPFGFPGSMSYAGNWVAGGASLALALSTFRAAYHYWSRRDSRRLAPTARRRAAGIIFAAAAAALVVAQFVTLADAPSSSPWSSFYRPGLLLSQAVVVLAGGVAVAVAVPRATGFHLLALWGAGAGLCLSLETTLEIADLPYATGELLLVGFLVVGLVGASIANWGTFHIDWDLTSKAAAVLGGPLLAVVVLLLSAAGHGDTVEALFGGGLIAITLLVVLLVAVAERVGAWRKRARIRRYEAARASAPPRELAHMASLSAAEWRRVRATSRRRIGRHLAWSSPSSRSCWWRWPSL